MTALSPAEVRIAALEAQADRIADKVGRLAQQRLMSVSDVRAIARAIVREELGAVAEDASGKAVELLTQIRDLLINGFQLTDDSPLGVDQPTDESHEFFDGLRQNHERIARLNTAATALGLHEQRLDLLEQHRILRHGSSPFAQSILDQAQAVAETNDVLRQSGERLREVREQTMRVHGELMDLRERADLIQQQVALLPDRRSQRSKLRGEVSDALHDDSSTSVSGRSEASGATGSSGPVAPFGAGGRP